MRLIDSEDAIKRCFFKQGPDYFSRIFLNIFKFASSYFEGTPPSSYFRCFRRYIINVILSMGKTLMDLCNLLGACFVINLSVGQISDSLRGCKKRMKSLLKKLFWYFARNHLGLQFPTLI